MELATAEPSFAGLAISADGQLLLYATPPYDSARVAALAVDLLSRFRVTPGSAHRNATRNQPAVIPARYTFVQLASWRDLIADSLFRVDSQVTTLDLDEARNRVVLGMRSEDPVRSARIEARLRDLRIPRDALLLEKALVEPISGRKRAAAVLSAPGLTLDSIFDPLVGGISHWTQHPSTLELDGDCSVGIVVLHDGVKKALVASHCTVATFEMQGVRFAQGTRGGNYMWMGFETSDPPGVRPGGILGTDIQRSSDAALITLSGPLDARVGLIARTQAWNGGGLQGGNGTTVVNQADPYLYVNATENNDLVVGTIVDKIGRTTGWTYGAITGTCVDVSVSGYRTTCTYKADVVNYGGDSGGPVFVWTYPGNAKLAGIATARSADKGELFFSKWSRVVTDLGPMTPLAGY